MNIADAEPVVEALLHRFRGWNAGHAQLDSHARVYEDGARDMLRELVKAGILQDWPARAGHTMEANR